MPRNSVRPEVFVGLSPNACATALGIPYRKIKAAIDLRQLEVYRHGVHRRILVRSLEQWVEACWIKIEPKTKESPHGR